MSFPCYCVRMLRSLIPHTGPQPMIEHVTTSVLLCTYLTDFDIRRDALQS